MSKKLLSLLAANSRMLNRAMLVGISLGCGLLPSAAEAQAADGSLDATLINRADFQPYPVFAHLARQADGKVIVAGDFTAVDDLSLNGLARLNPDGTLDRTFDAKIDQVSGVRAVVVLPDGNILIGGLFTSIRGVRREGIARLNSDGGLDTTFDPGAQATYYVNAMAVQPDGKVVIGGIYDVTSNASYRYLIARLNPNGSADNTFHDANIGEYNSGVSTLALQLDGKVLIAGAREINGQQRAVIERLNTNGTTDATFNIGSGGLDSQIYSLAVQSDGRIIVGGDFTRINTTPCTRVARLNTDGSVDSSFHGSADASVTKVTVQQDGKVFVSGFFMTVGDTSPYEQHAIARLKADGSPDMSFGVDIPFGVRGAPAIYDFLLLPMEKRVLIGGGFDELPDSSDPNADYIKVNGIAELRNGVSDAPSLVNIATRLRVEAGDNGMIAGFIVTGASSATKRVLIRGLGPSLSVPGTLSDPALELHDSSGAVIASNDNWQSGDISKIPTGFAPKDPRESLVVANLAAGTSSYTAVLKGAHGETGAGLIEVYDLDGPATAQLANIATRGLVKTGDDAMIGGVIIGGSGSAQVLLRVTGPSLKNAGFVGQLLDDPTLELHDSNGNVTFNDNWRDTQESEIAAKGLQPRDDREPAILTTLVPGSYTAVVRGKNNASGIGVVEAYQLQ